MTEALLLALCALLALAVVGLAVALRRAIERATADVAALRAEVERRVSALERTASAAPEPPDTRVEPVPPPVTGYVITRVGDAVGAGAADGVPVDQPIASPDARLFADLVLRESVVKAASFAHGVRRGLSPENRNKMWFEMRREVKRARKQRRADLRSAQRDWKARQRAAVDEDDAA